MLTKQELEGVFSVTAQLDVPLAVLADQLRAVNLDSSYVQRALTSFISLLNSPFVSEISSCAFLYFILQEIKTEELAPHPLLATLLPRLANAQPLLLNFCQRLLLRGGCQEAGKQTLFALRSLPDYQKTPNYSYFQGLAAKLGLGQVRKSAVVQNWVDSSQPEHRRECNIAFDPGFTAPCALIPEPQFSQILPCEYRWLSQSGEHRPAVQLINFEHKNDQLLSRAFEKALTLEEKEQLVSFIEVSPEVFNCTNFERLERLIEHNYEVGAALASRLILCYEAELFLKIVSLPPTNSSLGFMNKLIEMKTLPSEVINKYLVNTMDRTRGLEPVDRYPMARLLCVFMMKLAEGGGINLRILGEEIKQFCMDHTNFAEAGHLFRAVVAVLAVKK